MRKSVSQWDACISNRLMRRWFQCSCDTDLTQSRRKRSASVVESLAIWHVCLTDQCRRPDDDGATRPHSTPPCTVYIHDATFFDIRRRRGCMDSVRSVTIWARIDANSGDTVRQTTLRAVIAHRQSPGGPTATNIRGRRCPSTRLYFTDASPTGPVPTRDGAAVAPGRRIGGYCS